MGVGNLYLNVVQEDLNLRSFVFWDRNAYSESWGHSGRCLILGLV